MSEPSPPSFPTAGTPPEPRRPVGLCLAHGRRPAGHRGLPAWLLLPAYALLPILAGCGADPPSRAQGDNGKGCEGPREVRVVAAAREALPEVVIVTGSLAAEEEVQLAPKVAGRLAELSVDLGSRVERGQVLGRLAAADFSLGVSQAEAALSQAQARLGLASSEGAAQVDPEQTGVVKRAQAVLDEARANRERARKLHGENILSQAELDAAEAAYRVAESQHQDAREEVLNRLGVLSQRRSELELARQRLADSVLVAPFSGAIRERHVTPGQYVGAGQPVLTLVRTHPLRLRLAVPERQATRVRPGQEVRLHVEGDPRLYLGRVARTSPSIEESDRTLRVEAEVGNEDGALRPGAFANAEIVTAADRPAILVPASAIVVFAGIEKVITVDAGKSVETRVRTGRRVGDRVEILEGLEGGEQVVAEPGNLAGGQEVTLVS
jgi:RND family efflux transporter MFP subunit